MVDEKSFLVKVGSGDYLVPAIFLGLRSKALSSHVVDDEVSKKRTKASGKPDGPIRNTKQEYIPQSSPSEVLYHIVLHTHPVSYTHLDVYKRQALNIAIQGTGGIGIACAQDIEHIDWKTRSINALNVTIRLGNMHS